MKDFDRLAEAAANLADAWSEQTASHQGEWVDGSPLDTETGSAGPPFARQAEEAGRLANLCLVSSIDQLQGLAVLLANHERTTISPAPVARGVMEAASTCYYLTDPAIDVEERARRHYNERLATMHEQKLIADKLGNASESDRQASLIIAIEAEVTSAGLTFVRPRRKTAPPHIGNRPPSATALMQGVLDTGHLGTYLYSFLSGTAHARAHGIASYLIAVAPGTDGVVHTRVGISADEAARRYMGALLAVTGAGQRVSQMFGWDQTRMTLPVIGALTHWAGIAGMPQRTLAESLASQGIPAS